MPIYPVESMVYEPSDWFHPLNYPLFDAALGFGYVAKYRWLPKEEIILILAIRHQLEAGYSDDSEP